MTGAKAIESSLFAFIWKYSKRDQMILLMVTLSLFPLLYMTLELPKRIINDAIGSGTATITAFGMDFSGYFAICVGGLESGHASTAPDVVV